MARRIPSQSLIAALLFAIAVPVFARADPPGVLVRYSFDDELVETGPDTFAVWEKARGRVDLSAAYRTSGYHSVEIRDVPGDGDFPELQGYFAERDRGVVYAHFALLVTEPKERLNIALAGPEGFRLAKGGIAVWLRTRGGWLEHLTDGIPKKLLQPRPFSWYRVDLAYHVDRGRYDLQIAEEGASAPAVALSEQPNATSQPGSAIDKFSFIGDAGTDDSSVVYYVDDVLIGTDAAVARRDFAAPGRRKLFFAYLLETRTWRDTRPTCLPGATLGDFAIGPREAQALSRGPLGAAVRADLALAAPVGSPGAGESAAGLAAETQRRVMALRLWATGCRLLAAGRGADALREFESAARLAPEARGPRLAVLWALSALNRFDEVDARLPQVESDWRADPLFPVVMARLGLARGDFPEAEAWLRRPAESLIDAVAGSDGASRHLLDLYFYVLLWIDRPHDAERLALAAIATLEKAGGPAADWTERAGDAAFALGDHARARERYEQALRERPAAPQLLQKLSDVHFLIGDADGERAMRERIYGSLRGRP